MVSLFFVLLFNKSMIANLSQVKITFQLIYLCRLE